MKVGFDIRAGGGDMVELFPEKRQACTEAVKLLSRDCMQGRVDVGDLIQVLKLSHHGHETGILWSMLHKDCVLPRCTTCGIMVATFSVVGIVSSMAADLKLVRFVAAAR